MYKIENMPTTIDIGFTGEESFRKVEIDMTAWMLLMPDGTPSIVCIRPGEDADDAYLAETTFVDNILTWTVTLNDLGAVEGAGVMQVWLEKTQNTTLQKRGKSIVVSTYIHGSISDPGDTIPPARTALLNLTAEAESLDADEQPTAEWEHDGYYGDFNLKLGIPSGTTFTPSVDASGNISWTNDGGKTNPTTMNIKGPQGDPAPDELVISTVNTKVASIITNPDSPPLDRSLTSSSSATPADITGNLKSAISDENNIIIRSEDLRSALYAEPYISTGFVQGARGRDVNITVSNDRCTTALVWDLKEGDKFKIINPTGRLAAVGGVKNGVFVYENYWLSGNFEYTVTSLTEGTYYANFKYSSSGENLSPSDLSGVKISIERKTAITELREDVDDLANNLIFEKTNTIHVEQGTYLAADGSESYYTTWCRSGWIDKNVILESNLILMYLLAYTKAGVYVGIWNHSEFSTTYDSSKFLKRINIREWLELYPNYQFKVDYHKSNNNDITPSEVLSDLTVSDYADQKKPDLKYVERNSLYSKAELENANDGENIINLIPIVSGHKYKICAQTDTLISATELRLGLGSNGNIILSPSELYFGYVWEKTADTSNASGRVYCTVKGLTNDGNISVSITDMTDPDNFTYNKPITKLSEPWGIKWYDGRINANFGTIENTGSYMHSNILLIDTDAEVVFSGNTLRFYDEYMRLVGSTSQATRNAVTQGTYKYVQICITGQDPTNVRVYPDINEADYLGYDYVASVMRKTSGSANATNNMKQYFTIVHVTDAHGDRTRFCRAVDFAEKIGATAIINTGDSVRFYGSDDFSYVTNRINKCKIPYMSVVGNHECNGYTSESDIYTKFISPFVDGNGYQLGGTGKPYYYVDFATYKIRVIVIDQYEKYDGSMATTMSSTQLNWICSTLGNTPENYGVVICEHVPEVGVNKDEDHAIFYQEQAAQEFTRKCVLGIVDAFIQGTTYSGSPWGDSISYDFSNKNTGVFFVAYLNGHQHSDRIGYASGTDEMQLVLNAICTNAWFNIKRDGTIGTDYPYYNELNDLGRFENTPSQDAFNVYCIDTANNVVKVARIGTSITVDFKERRIMEIPFRT